MGTTMVENKYKLGMTALSLVENNKGIYAADESPSSLDKKFKSYKIDNTYQNRLDLRKSLFKTSKINNMISGVILHEETFTQKDDNGKLIVEFLLEQGIQLGIKLDKGLRELEEEKISIGIEDLEKRIQSDIFKKATFAKWRSLFYISDELPSQKAIDENIEILSQYAKICQKYDKVPIVEPEIPWKGSYTIEKNAKIAKLIISRLFAKLNEYDVYIPGVLLKVGFITNGIDDPMSSPSDVSLHTLQTLLSSVPSGVRGVVFLSGGHPPEEAFEYLQKVNKEKGNRTFSLSYSYGRALSNDSLEAFGQKLGEYEIQSRFYKNLKKCQ